MSGPRVLLVLGASAGWSRGILRGFSGAAREQGWNLLHYQPAWTDLRWLADVWKPAAAVLGPEVEGAWPPSLETGVRVSVNADRTAEGVTSVFLDEKQIAAEVFAHFAAKGLNDLTSFRFDHSPFAIARERAFRDVVAAAGIRLAHGWWPDGANASGGGEDPAALVAWLGQLPKPCGVFACCDAWATVVARYARLCELRVPEDISIVGVDNDAIECELSVPPLSSVIVPWQSLGRHAAALVAAGLAGKAAPAERVVVKPGHVVARRSSDALAIQDALVARAVRWIREHASGRLTVPRWRARWRRAAADSSAASTPSSVAPSSTKFAGPGSRRPSACSPAPRKDWPTWREPAASRAQGS